MRVRRKARRAVLVAFTLATTALACAELGTGVDDVSYIAFDAIPYPALLVGDTLRDSLGVATPLRASAFDASGRAIVDADFRYFVLDTGVVIDASGMLRATTRTSGTVRLVASLDGLQTDDRLVRVTRRPDSLVLTTSQAITFNYAVPDVATNLAAEMGVRLMTFDSVGASNSGVGGWLVRWRAIHGTDTLAANDTSLVVLQTTAGKRTVVDTTPADGLSSRRLRVFASRLTSPVDSFIVIADVRRYGTPLRGSPIRFVVRIAPPAP